VDRPVGRDSEQVVLETFLAAAASEVAVLVLEGEAGIGKSTLIRHVGVVAAASGIGVLAAHPSAAERDLSFSVLTDLLGQFGDDELDQLADPQRNALLVAALRKPVADTPADLRAIGTGMAALLTARVADGPVLLVVDDEQWVDPPSHAALVFAVRRITGGPFGLLVARRTPVAAGPELGSAPELPFWRKHVALQGVSAAALFHIVKRELGESMSRPTLTRVTEASGGNPYFAIELARSAALDGGGAALRIPQSLSTLTSERLSRLSAAARRAATAVAATSRPTPQLLAALGMTDGLDEAVRAEVLRIASDRIAFSHPLLASAALDLLDASELRELHRRLADSVDDAEATARHSALAIDRTDEDVAVALDRASRSAELRGAPTTAVELSKLALDRTDPAGSQQLWARRIRLAELLHLCGETTRAAESLADLEQCPDPPLRSRGWLIGTEIAYQTEATSKAVACARLALRDARAAEDTTLIVRSLLSLAALGGENLEGMTYVAQAGRLVQAGKIEDPMLTAWALCEDVSARFHLGNGLDEALLDQAQELERTNRSWSSSDQVAATRPVLLKWADRPDQALAALRELRSRAEADGNESIVTYADGHLSGLLLRMGDAPAAESVANEQHRRASGAGQRSQQMQALFNTAMVTLYTGRLAEAEAGAIVVSDWADEAGDEWARRSSSAVLGTATLWRGDASGACAHFQRWADSCASGGIVDPGISRFHGEHIEALVLTGDIAAAAQATAQLAILAERARRHSALALAERARGLLASVAGQPEQALSHLMVALREHSLAPVPFERARTLLLAGRMHRRIRARPQANQALAESAALFHRVGSVNWHGEAKRELDRLTSHQSGPLTASEKAVAELAATGLTNRQVAQRMFISPKTVEAHLAHVYSKLEISSRAQLGARMRGDR
jgi:DNA-binding NarL/FixJ family response regulator